MSRIKTRAKPRTPLSAALFQPPYIPRIARQPILRRAEPSPFPWIFVLDLLLFVLIFSAQLVFAIDRCGNTFCGGDSLWYARLLQSGDWMGTGSGILVFIPLWLLQTVVGSTLAIYILAALLSAFFFLAMTRLAQLLLHHNLFARLVALCGVWSFWWLRISFDLYKNELALLLLLTGLAWYWPRRTHHRHGVPGMLALGALLLFLAHISTFFFVAIALLLYGVWSFWQNRRWHSLGCLLLLLIALGIGTMVSRASLETQDPIYLYFNQLEAQAYQFFYLASLPALLVGLWSLHRKEGDGSPVILVGAFLLASFLLGFLPFMPPQWQFRFLLDGFWALMLILAASISFAAASLHSSRPWQSRFILSTLFLVYVLILVIVGALQTSDWTHVQANYSVKQLSDLSSLLSTTQMSTLYLPSPNYWLSPVVRSSGFTGPVLSGYCPCDGSAPSESWMVMFNLSDIIHQQPPSQAAWLQEVLNNQTSCSLPPTMQGDFVAWPCIASGRSK